MSSRRRWKTAATVIDLCSSDDEDMRREEAPKRRRKAGPASGKAHLPLQLSQGQKGGSQMQEQAEHQQPQKAPAAGAKSGLAALMGVGSKAGGQGDLLEKTGLVPSPTAELWVTKHAPRSEADLVVHKKKVQELRQWMEWQRSSLGQRGVGRVAVVTGPPGCGKSTVVHILAAAVRLEPCEWEPPTPTLWHEYQHQAGSGIKYVSKLDAFEEFSLRAKLPSLTLSKSQPSAEAPAARAPSLPAPSQQAQQQAGAVPSQQPSAAEREGAGTAVAGLQLPKLLIVDDLPHAANPEQRQRLAAALGDLARTTRFPLVVMATETSGKSQQEKGLNAGASSFQGLHKEVIAALEAAHATTFSLNPVTTMNTCKALHAILEKERMAVSEEQVQAIAEQAQGDLHNAISTLQFVCTGAKAAAAPQAKKGRDAKRKAAAPAAGSKAQAVAAQQAQQGQSVPFASRDSTLTMFHALGKLLYNKRLGGSSGKPDASPGQEGGARKKQQAASRKAAPPAAQHSAADGDGGSSSGPAEDARWKRAPLDFDPEAVIERSGLDAGGVSAYLHENLHNFVDEAAVEDMAGCLDYLSQADCIASGFRYGGGGVTLVDDELPSSTLADAAAGSTAARGVCFSNAHPAPRRWLPLSAPTAFLVEKAARQNRGELQQRVAGTWATRGGHWHLESTRSMACELLPLLRSIHCYSRDPRLLELQPARWARVWQGQLYDSAPGVAAGAWGSGGGGPEGGEAEGPSGTGTDDAIEESEDEDDW